MASTRFIVKAQAAYRQAVADGDTEEAGRVFRAIELAMCGESDRTARQISGWSPKLGVDGRV